MHELKKTSTGVWMIDQTRMELLGEEQDGGFTVQRSAVHMGGQPSKRAHNLAVAALYGGSGEIDLQMHTLAVRKEQCTMLIVDESGGVSAREGKMLYADGKLAFIKKGSSSKGYYINEKFRPLDIAVGYNRQEALAEQWWRNDELVPQVRNADFEGIPEYSEDDSSNYDEDGNELSPRLISAVFLLDYPDFEGGTVAGCMFLATDQQSEDADPGLEIVNGYLWAPADCSLFSEHGSQYLKDIERIGGRVTNFTPGKLTFAECVADKIPGTRRGAYAYVLGAAAEPHELTCVECGADMWIDESGVSHHWGGGVDSIDHDRDAEHVAVAES